MCGIAGIFARQPQHPIATEQLQKISAAMQQRGPDGHGQWLEDDNSVGLAHRRLAIIDLSTAALQPMLDTTERYVISYNGEIYNYSVLREQCQQQGYAFKSNSDTEVLLALYQLQGAAMLTQLRGMFALAIYDRQMQTLFLARDPYGIKPLYYAITPYAISSDVITDDGGAPKLAAENTAMSSQATTAQVDTSPTGQQIVFASSLNALQQAGVISAAKQDDVALAHFFNTGSVAEPRTYFAEAKMLPAASYLLLGRDDVAASATLEPQIYWQLPKPMRASSKKKPIARRFNEEEANQLVCAAVEDSVATHMVADVPVGVFLSAGIDSNVIAACMRRHTQQPIIAITLGFDEYIGSADDEVVLAAEMAQRYALEHHVYRLSREEFLQELPRFFAAMEQPTMDGLNVWFVAKAAKKLGLKVVLSGLGGDELFGGYPSFSRIPKLLPWTSLIKHLPMAWLAKKIPYQFNQARLNNRKLLGLPHYCDSIASLYRLQRAVYLFEELHQVLREMGFAEQQIQSSLVQLQDYIDQQYPTTNASTPASVLAEITRLESENYMRNQLLRDADWTGMAHSLEIRTPLVDHQLADALAKVPDQWRYQPNKAALIKLLPVADQQLLAQRPKTGFTLPIRQWLQDEPGKGASDRLASVEREVSEHWSRAYTQQVYQQFSQRFC